MVQRGILGVVSACLGLLSCDGGAIVRILDARATREPDGRVAMEVELEAAEQGGGSIGSYCVSVHWFDLGLGPPPETLRAYPGQVDGARECASDLSDGDQRTYRLLSTRSDLAPGLASRVEVLHARKFVTHDGVLAP